jgi:flagellar protein FlbB
MRRISEKTKIIYLIILVIFILIVGFLWLDYIGFINLAKMTGIYYKEEAPSVLEAKDDEPSLIEREEFEKEKQKLLERIEELDKREMQIIENEKAIEAKKEKLDEIKSGLDLEKKKLENEKRRYSGYKRNVMDLAQKIESMRPEEAVEIMVKWEEPLIIDVLRQMDTNAEEEGRASITSYLISLMPREKASRIMYLMTQL